jgi:hypothetical protein
MVILIPTKENTTRREIDAYIHEMMVSNNYSILNRTVREIQYKSGVGALLHPAEEYFVDAFNNSVKNMSLGDLRLPDQRCNSD